MAMATIFDERPHGAATPGRAGSAPVRAARSSRALEADRAGQAVERARRRMRRRQCARRLPEPSDRRPRSTTASPRPCLTLTCAPSATPSWSSKRSGACAPAAAARPRSAAAVGNGARARRRSRSARRRRARSARGSSRGLVDRDVGAVVEPCRRSHSRPARQHDARTCSETSNVESVEPEHRTEHAQHLPAGARLAERRHDAVEAPAAGLRN